MDTGHLNFKCKWKLTFILIFNITAIEKSESVSCSVMSDSVTLWTVPYQAPLSMEFSSKEYWSGLPFPPPGDLPNPGIKPSLLHLLLWLGYLNGGGGAPFTKVRFLISLKSMEDLITHGPSLLEPSRNRPFGGHVLLPHHLLSPHIHTRWHHLSVRLA